MEVVAQHDFTFRERLRYRIDNVLSRGAAGMVVVLFSFAVLFLIAAALFITILKIRGNEDESLPFHEAFWQSMLRAMDPGAIGADIPWPFRLTSLIITIMGIFIVSALIGILATGLDSRLAALQRGRGRIAVSGHTLVLGWSPKIMTLINELAIAKQSQPGGTVAILADRDKREMDELIAARLPASQLHGLTVVTRRGEPSESSDLALVNPDLAGSIVVLSDASSARDAGVIKTVLGLFGQSQIPTSVPIIAELASPARAQALRSVSTQQVAIVEPGEIIARAAAQSSREVGLNLVLQELFDFAGSEIYFAQIPQATGQAFGDLLNCFDQSSLIGLRAADATVRVNPPMETVVGEGDQLIVIAEDDSAIAWTGPRDTAPSTPLTVPGAGGDRSPEVIVMLGWNDYGLPIVTHLDRYVPNGSELTIVVDPKLVQSGSVRLPDGLLNMAVRVVEIPDEEDPVGTILGEIDCDHVLILCYRTETIDPNEAESRALTTFLEARSVLARLGRQANVTAELLDERDVELIPSATAGEFMVSEKLASLIMAQLSENIGLQPVFADLLDPEGSEIYCKPVERYATLGIATPFAALVERARLYGEVAIGWRLDRNRTDAEHGFGVVVNPDKSSSVTFEAGDQLVVLAEDDD